MLNLRHVNALLSVYIAHHQLVVFLDYIFFDRFQQTLLVLLNIGHTPFGPRSTALLMNMMALQDAAAVNEWRSV